MQKWEPVKLTPEQQEFVDMMTPELPKLIARKAVSKVTGGIISARALEKADRAGNGPEIRYRTAAGIAYERTALLNWYVVRYAPKQLANINCLI
ncbi:hypothetical protein [Desulfoluna butyratoxydans]|uniref:Uncharacterized protein n=1 Tax=Desulfoluna butyratoxydans TaxID=231438 RepID=A0A4U8YSU2_9BACT|nr:hypothetical protein [Desulfoluna butyratoxydans]VFQ44363.1 hypothetical protein MSL71_20120 [Desulfoluna butyratoxydans]